MFCGAFLRKAVEGNHVGWMLGMRPPPLMHMKKWCPPPQELNMGVLLLGGFR
jgi:hypothetical protein